MIDFAAFSQPPAFSSLGVSPHDLDTKAESMLLFRSWGPV